ncbi:unknown [Clostridium sp. CAG:299]|nr:unknown [Clostridium sp. CAG:299]
MAISGPKSVIAPTQRKIRHGKRLDFTPPYMMRRTPWVYHGSDSFIRSANGRFARNIPNAIGRRRSGSYCFLIAIYNRIKEIRNITQLRHVRAAKPDCASNSPKIEKKFITYLLVQDDHCCSCIYRITCIYKYLADSSVCRRNDLCFHLHSFHDY